jgi:hypothetical protein
VIATLLAFVASTAPAGIQTRLLDYGIAGIVILALGSAAVVDRRRAQVREDRLWAEVTRLRDQMADKVVPALMASSAANTEATKVMQELLREMAIRDSRRDRERG